MSWVTNIVLHIGLEDGENEEGKIIEVNRYFDEKSEKGLVSLDDSSLPSGWYGGSKYLEVNLYAGAFNYLDLGEFSEHLRRLEWVEPASVQLLVSEQEDERFRLINVFD